MSEIKLSELNRLADTPKSTVEAAEALYRAKIEETADAIVSDGRVRALLLAGPSGAGKTTTANLLADAVRARGHGSTVISLDDFYLDGEDPRYPRLADGSRNMECAEALDLAGIARTLSDILAGRSFTVPKYDFKTAAPIGENTYPAFTDGCVIIEGLHALNPKIAGDLPREALLRLFVSVSTNLISDTGERVLSGRKIRFLRRLVRDSLYRGADAVHTLRLWRRVLAGEDAYLYPYRSLADVSFDTFHTFEVGVMRPFAEAVMSEASLADPYMQEVAAALRCVSPMEEAFVPETSLIREFIPGGKYEHLY